MSTKLWRSSSLIAEEIYTRQSYEIISLTGAAYVLKDVTDNTTHSGVVAASCILEPCEGDIVSAIKYAGELYIDTILKRNSLEPRKYRLKGEVVAGFDESQLSITPKEISLKSNNLTFTTKLMNLVADISKWCLKGLDIRSKLITQRSKEQHIECEEKLSFTTANRETNISNLDYEQANIVIQKNKEMNLTTDKFNINT